MEIEVGCDVSQRYIDVQVLEPQRRRRIRNNRKELERLAAELPPGSFVGMEATGTLHELLADILTEAGHTVYVINPRWIHRYAGSIGARGKTDRSDAMVIARYVHAERRNLHRYRVPSPQQRELRRLLHRRAEARKLMTAASQGLGEEATEAVDALAKLVRDIDKRIRALIEADACWSAWARRLRAVPGIGPLVVAHLIEALASRPFAAAHAFIAHTGLDPRPNDSGARRGRRRLTHHGDALLRASLFMAAMASSKVPEWRALYERYRRKGLASTAALVVVARKIARVAFSLVKSGEDYDPNRLKVAEGLA